MSIFSSYNPVPLSGRNKIRNGALDVWQRGFGAFTVNQYTADGWSMSTNGGSHSVTAQNFTLGGGDIPSINGGVDSPLFIRTVVTGAAGAANYNVMFLRIEDVRTLANRKATLSFWAKGATALPMAVELNQVFGTGGSPSAAVTGTGQKVTLSTAWKRYQFVLTVPSITGKTLGTNGDHNLTVLLWFSGGSDYNTRNGTLGTQSGTFDIWGVQLEEGTEATPLERLDFEAEISRSMRYFQRHFDPPLRGVVTGGNVGRMGMPLPVFMRANPTVSASGTTNLYDGTAVTVATAITVQYTTYQHVEMDMSSGVGLTNGRPAILWKNSAASVFDFSAEL